MIFCSVPKNSELDCYSRKVKFLKSRLYLSVLANVILEVVILVQDWFGNDVVVVDTDCGGELCLRLALDLTQPSDLEGLLEVLVLKVGLGLHRGDLSGGDVLVDLFYHEVAPVDEGGVLTLFQRLGVRTVDNNCKK